MQLSKFTKRFIFIIAFVSTFLAFFVSIFFQYNNFAKDNSYIKDEFTEIKKREIKREVTSVYDLIKHKEESLEKAVQERLKERVLQAYSIAMNIYETNKNTKTTDEIKYLIASTLNNIQYQNNSTYFFINSNKGQAILFNKELKLHKYEDIWYLKDGKDSFIIQEQAKIALEKKEGFITNSFVKPNINDTKTYSKISFVKLFEPFDWHIGTGEYIDEIREKNQNELLEWIASVRFEDSGYIFVNSMNGNTLVFDGKKIDKPSKYPFPELMQKQIEASKNPAGGFFTYKFKKINTQEEFDKISFVRTYEKYDWIIGSGVYLDEIEKELQRKKEIFNQTINNQVKSMIIIFIILLITIYYISEKMSNYINQNINNLISSFNKASKNNEKINTKDLTYKEFVLLANNLNTALENKNRIEKKLQNYIQIVNENIIISTTDKNGIITDVSEAFCEISGYSKKELIGKSHGVVRHPQTSDEFYDNMWKELLSGKEWKGEIKDRNKKGEDYWVFAIIRPIFRNNLIHGFTAIRTNITDKKHIELLSITDELTKLYNRRFFNTKINEEINRAKREKNHLSFLILDIDYFKQYNDTYGHQKGDTVLEEVSKVLKHRTNRASDFAFRLGGEEFGILTTLDKEKAIEFANLIRQDIEDLKIENCGSTVCKYLTISIGLVSKESSEIINSDKLYKEADDNLYEAKRLGRNCIYIQ